MRGLRGHLPGSRFLLHHSPDFPQQASAFPDLRSEFRCLQSAFHKPWLRGDVALTLMKFKLPGALGGALPSFIHFYSLKRASKFCLHSGPAKHTSTPALAHLAPNKCVHLSCPPSYSLDLPLLPFCASLQGQRVPAFPTVHLSQALLR